MDEEATLNFNVFTQIAPSDYSSLIDFIHQNYILSNIKYFTNIVREISDEKCILSFTFNDPEGRGHIDVQVEVGHPLLIKMIVNNRNLLQLYPYWLRNNLVSVIRFFEEQHRRIPIYFALPEKEIAMEKAGKDHENLVYRMFSESMFSESMLLFFLTSSEYLLRFYVLWPVFYVFGYLYILIALGMVYFIAKFFESKADLESAIRIGEPKTLASALRKIGYRKLQLEASRGYALQEWIGWDPHPPIYFRITRLEGIVESDKIKHPLVRSIRDNIVGFLQVLA
jgi:hypothetical protein